MDKELLARISRATKPKNRDSVISGSYTDDIFLLEMPEGGDVTDVRAVGFTGWEGTLQNEPTKSVRFYAKVVAFEDTRAPERNWNMEKGKIELPAVDLTEFIKKVF